MESEFTKTFTSMISQENGLDRQEIEPAVIQNVEQMATLMYEGLKACLYGLQQNQEYVVEDLVVELQSCFKALASPRQLSQFGKKALAGISLKEELGISNNSMQALYQGAKSLFDMKEYTEAEKAFFVICSIDPSQYAYWVGLGHASFLEKNFQQAINAYSMASAFYPENIWPHIWAANCFEEEQDWAHAKMALQNALSIHKAANPKNDTVIQSLERRMQKINSQ